MSNTNIISNTIITDNSINIDNSFINRDNAITIDDTDNVNITANSIHNIDATDNKNNTDNISNEDNTNNTSNNNYKNIIHITDFNAPELDVYARYTEVQLLNRHYPEKGLFIAESPLVVERALNAGCVPVSCLIETKHIEGQAKHIIDRLGNIPVYTAEFNVLTQLTGFPLTRGMLCCMKRPKLPALEEICKNAKRIAILENVMNPTNVGAIFRSAAALSIDAVLLTPACSNPLYRRAIRVSMGTVFQIPWTFLGDEATDQPATDVETLKSLGFKTAAMALTDNCVSIDNPSLMAEEKLAIILGTEGEGLAASTIEACDYTIKIPMAPGVDSLNVAAASAVAFWQLGRK